MKILFVIDSLRFGGAERQLVELVKGLFHRDTEVHLICLDSDTGGYTDILRTLGIRIHYFCRSNKYDARPVLSIARYIRQHQIDLVHSFMNLGSLVGALSAKLSKRPVVCSAIRDAGDTNFKGKISKKLLAGFADILVSNSRAGFANRFEKLSSNFRVVYNGVDFNRFQGEKVDLVALKNDLGVSQCKHIIGFVASLSENKDQETLLNAAPMVLQFFPGTCFLLVGDGSERKKLEEKARQLGLQNNVVFSGYRKDADQIYHILDLAVLLTNSDIHLEGISNAIIEAMAVGVPVIASRGGGTDEIIKNDLNGLLVKPKNSEAAARAIISLLTNSKKADKLAKIANTCVREKFSVKRYVEEYEKIYRQFLPLSPTPSNILDKNK